MHLPSQFRVFWHYMFQRHTYQNDKRFISEPYDLGNEFYALWLDKDMQYTCGYFARPENLRFEGRTLGDVGKEIGGDLVDVLCDLLLAEGLRLNQVTPGPHTDGIRRFYRHPVSMVGTDSTFVGAKPSPRSYGSYPRILGQFVRDEALLSLEAAVAKMTSMPAARLGLKRRGRIADGFVADIVVFDPKTVRANATYDEPRRFPDGIEHVIVNGTPVIDGGQHTGALPGRALRRGRD